MVMAQTLFIGAILATMGLLADAFTTSSTWVGSRVVQERRNSPSPLSLFGGAEQAPVVSKQPDDEQEKMRREEYEMAMVFQKEMGEKLKSIELTGSSDGVTCVYTADQLPVSITVSESAMEGGSAKVAEASVEAIIQAQASAAKEMQTVMASMQKELMATLQAQEAGNNKK
mmetsp:Transcript_16739/g.33192  ORF Transcript_16739/g.33192 Transcript_16739/m.33192 type:complete len:171 (+) Transcript_16739:33-545(+)